MAAPSMAFEILERRARSSFESAAKKIHSEPEETLPLLKDLVSLANSSRNSKSKLPSRETLAPGFTPSFSIRDFGWRILSRHFSAVAPRWKTASPSAVCKRSSPSAAFADLIVAKAIFSRKSPRKRISLVSSNAFPSDSCLPHQAVHCTSLPTVDHLPYCQFAPGA